MSDRDEDDIEASKAPLMDHLVELRRRLMWSILAVGAAFLLCFAFAKEIYNLLLWPYRWAAGVNTPIEMIYTAPQEFFFTEMKLALFGAIFIAFPVIASQIYMFVAPGLYRNERRAFLPFLAATPILFLIGAALVYFMAMPLAMTFFLSMQQTGEDGVTIALTARVSEYLSLIMTLILAFGVCFQLPVVLTLLARAGIIGSDWLRKNRRYAIMILVIIAAILTPPDPISQLALWIPTIALYELSSTPWPSRSGSATRPPKPTASRASDDPNSEHVGGMRRHPMTKRGHRPIGEASFSGEKNRSSRARHQMDSRQSRRLRQRPDRPRLRRSQGAVESDPQAGRTTA